MALRRLVLIAFLLISFSNVSHSIATGERLCCSDACKPGKYELRNTIFVCTATNVCDAWTVCQDGTCVPSTSPAYEARCATCGTCDGTGSCSQPLPCGAPCSTTSIYNGVCNGIGISDSYCMPPQQALGTCYCNEMCASGKCCPDNTCAAATNGCCSDSDCPAGSSCDLTKKTCVSNCQADCTLGDGICHAECNGVNGCSLIANCAGKTKGLAVCVDGYSTGVCCEGPLTSCGVNSTACPAPYCSPGGLLCTYPPSGSCNIPCSGGVCTSCNACVAACASCPSGQICCSNTCRTPLCSADADCDDRDASTKDTCLNPGSCNAECVHTAIALCGNGRCDTEKGENYCNCPRECGVDTCSGDVQGEVCKKYVCSGSSCVQVYKENCCGNKVCEAGEGCWSCPADCSCPAGQQCLYDRCTAKKLLPNGAECTNNEECSSGHCEFGYCCAAGLCCRLDSQCPSGQTCVNYSCQLLGKKCSDGTPTGQCSADKPKYCNNGIWVYACSTCGCPEDQICKMDGTCYALGCNDGTQQGSCSATKPLFCNKDRELVERCSQCGCPERFVCERKGEFCYRRPTLSILSPIENQTINVGEERRVLVSGIVVKDEKPVSFTIEGNDSRFLLAEYNSTTGEFVFENITPIGEGYLALNVRVADGEGDLLASEVRSFKVLNAPPGMIDVQSLQALPFGVVQLVLLVVFLILLLNLLLPIVGRMMLGPIAFPEGSIVLIEGAVGSGKEEFCMETLRRKVKEGKFCVVLSCDPAKEEAWFNNWEKNKLLFIKVEPDINELAWSISKMLSGEPHLAFINVLNLLITKYNPEELGDFLNTNFQKLRNAKCGALFIVDKGVSDEVLSAVEGLFDGVVEFQLKEEKGKLSSQFRIKEFKLQKFDTSWRRFK